MNQKRRIHSSKAEPAVYFKNSQLRKLALLDGLTQLSNFRKIKFFDMFSHRAVTNVTHAEKMNYRLEKQDLRV